VTNRQKERLGTILERLRSVVAKQASDIQGLVGSEWERFTAFLAILLQELLLREIAGFKNPAFDSERERRFIAHLPSMTGLLRGWPRDVVEFKTARGMIVPYIKLFPSSTNEKLPIASVRLGPSLDLLRAKTPLELVFRSYGYGDAQISGSEIPVLLG
jgi:hypothetical protein